MPPQYARSEVMLTFFERSPLDQVLRNDKVHRIQPCCQSPIKISGLCDLLKQRWRLCWHVSRWLNALHFYRNHAVQRILPGQHRNHRVWSQSARWEREAVVHRLCGTYVSIKSPSVTSVSSLSHKLLHPSAWYFVCTFMTVCLRTSPGCGDSHV